jgi:hypothetical protein
MVELQNAQAAAAVTPALTLVEPRPLPLSVEAAYESWLFHGPVFAGIDRVDGVGTNGIVATLKPSAPESFFSYRPSGTWVIDPVIVDSGLQLLILWARHHLDATPLPSRLGACRVWGAAGAGPVRCDVEVVHKPGSATLVSQLRFFDARDQLFAELSQMEVTFSKALNRLAGVSAMAGGRG